jgi:glycosyltransferase involved in cell wall biosynthesis
VRVLFVAPTLPWPPDAGGRIRTSSLLRELAPRHELRLVCVRQPGAGAAEEKALRGLGLELEVLPRGPRGPLARLSGPAEEGWFWSPALRRRLARLDLEGHDLVHLDELSCVRALPAAQRTPLVVHHHKLDRELAVALAAGPARARLAAARWELLEREATARTRRHLTTTAEDAALLRARHPGLEVGVVRNGVRLAGGAAPTGERDPDLLLALGSLDYAPNARGLARFLRVGWPRLAARRPGTRLAVVGRGAPAAPLGPLPPGVELVGEVPDPAPWLARAAALVVPLEVGGGSRLKILEAAAAGLPVLSTRVGAEGLELEDGAHLALADDLAELGALAADALGRPDALARRAAAARERVEERYGWGRAAAELEAAWEAAASSAR